MVCPETNKIALELNNQLKKMKNLIYYKTVFFFLIINVLPYHNIRHLYFKGINIIAVDPVITVVMLIHCFEENKTLLSRYINQF